MTAAGWSSLDARLTAAAGWGERAAERIATATAKHCFDERHDTPCPQPCEACDEECHHHADAEVAAYECAVMAAHVANQILDAMETEETK